MYTEGNMKRNLTAGCLFLLGLPALAIEAPGTSAPIPPQPSAGETRRSADITPTLPGARGGLTAPDRDENDGALPSLPPAQDGPATAISGAYFGIGGAEIPDILAEHLKLSAGEGIVVRTLDPDGPAAKAGLSVNDIVTHLDGKNVGSHDDLRQLMSGHKAGDEVSVDYIHKGEAKNVRVTLDPGRAAGAVAREMEPLDQLRQGGMAADQAQRIRETVERDLRAFEDADRDMARDAAPDIDAVDQLQRGLQERIQRMMGGAQGRGFQFRGGIGNAGPGANGMSFKSTSSVKLLDDKGSIEIRSEDDSKTVRALDKNGKVQWEGPYNSDEDKKAMPDDVRDRVEKLSPDMDFKGKGFRLNLGPRR
jgi:hypothetical protein